MSSDNVSVPAAPELLEEAAIGTPDAVDRLQAQVRELEAALKRANAGFEEYERRYYLTCDERDALLLCSCIGLDPTCPTHGPNPPEPPADNGKSPCCGHPRGDGSGHYPSCDAAPADNALAKVLEGLRVGGCWCEVGVGNPMVRGHSPQCDAARAALAGLTGK